MPLQIALCVLVLLDAAIVLSEILLDLHAMRSQLISLSLSLSLYLSIYLTIIYTVTHRNVTDKFCQLLSFFCVIVPIALVNLCVYV